ncbi:MAG TPA: class I SAM-dependent methyltransferase [Trebonia sp.]
MPQTMTAAARRRWEELLGGLVPLIPAGTTAVIDGPADNDPALAQAAFDRIISALNAAGHRCAQRPSPYAGPPGDGLPGDRLSGDGREEGNGHHAVGGLPPGTGPRPGEVVIWLRTTQPRRGSTDGDTGADVVIDAYNPDWPVIRRVSAPLSGRGPWYLTETRAFFAVRAADWDSKFGDDMPVYAAAVREAGIADGGTVIDVGCGTGRAIPPLREAVGPSGTVLAVDLTPEMLEEARPKCAMARAALVLADARRLPLADGAADAVFAAGLVTHLPDPVAGFAELARVTRSGGRLVLFHPSGRAALAARHGRTLRPDEPLAAGPLRDATTAAGWELTAYDDAADRFFALAIRR